MVSELKNLQVHDSTVNANVSGVKEHYENCNIYQAEKEKQSDDQISAIIPAIVKHSEKNQSLADENKSLKREVSWLQNELKREKKENSEKIEKLKDELKTLSAEQKTLSAELEKEKTEREKIRVEKNQLQRKIITMHSENYLAISNNLLAGQQEVSYSLKLLDEMSTPRKCRSLSNYSSVR